jgi:AbrB family looped-hinge helix DNA binding protein
LTTVTISTKYQVVIPSEVRDRLKLKPGQKVAVIEKDGVVHLIPVRPLKELKGMAAGITSKGVRDEGDPLLRLKPVRFKQKVNSSEIDWFLYHAK